jgi:hypothetical protein
LFSTNATTKTNAIIVDAKELGRVAAMSPPASLLDRAKSWSAVGNFLDDFFWYLAPFAEAAHPRRIRELGIPLFMC